MEVAVDEPGAAGQGLQVASHTVAQQSMEEVETIVDGLKNGKSHGTQDQGSPCSYLGSQPSSRGTFCFFANYFKSYQEKQNGIGLGNID